MTLLLNSDNSGAIARRSRYGDRGATERGKVKLDQLFDEKRGFNRFGYSRNNQGLDRGARSTSADSRLCSWIPQAFGKRMTPLKPKELHGPSESETVRTLHSGLPVAWMRTILMRRKMDVLRIKTKCDLAPHTQFPDDYVKVSTVTGAGINVLIARIVEFAHSRLGGLANSLITTQRQRAAILEADGALERFLQVKVRKSSCWRRNCDLPRGA